MKYCALLIVVALSLCSFGQVNPVPTIDAPVYPQAVVPGSNAFTLTVRGAGFVPGAVVNWNSAPRSTTYISAGELQAQILASDVAVAGSSLITVTNPPPGGGLSSSSFGMMEIHQPISSIMVTQPKGYAGYGGVLYTADLNGDSKQDMVQLGGGVGGVTVLLGAGDGSFTKSASLPAQNNAVGLSFGDFNGDGKMDFAFAMNYKGLIFVALGDGTGKFHFLPAFGSFTRPVQTVAGDFNRDGKLDLAVADSNGVSILLGNGDGTFQPQQSVLSLMYGIALIAADFNGDGVLDLALVSNGSDTISVVLGNGDGTFQLAIETQAPVYVQSWVSDFNGDGKLDFVILTVGSPQRIGIVLGNGDGTFQLPQKYYSTGFYPQALFLMVGDFNSDGNSDVFSYGELGNLAGFLAGNGDGTFQRVSRFTMPGPMEKGNPIVGDFNSDGLLDFAVGAHVGAQVYLQAPQ
jgi:hypothetical protein